MFLSLCLVFRVLSDLVRLELFLGLQVLLFQTMELVQVHQVISGRGVKCDKRALIQFLDSEGISFSQKLGTRVRKRRGAIKRPKPPKAAVK